MLAYMRFFQKNISITSRAPTQIVLCVVQCFRVGTRLVLHSECYSKHSFTSKLQLFVLCVELVLGVGTHRV